MSELCKICGNILVKPDFNSEKIRSTDLICPFENPQDTHYLKTKTNLFMIYFKQLTLWVYQNELYIHDSFEDTTTRIAGHPFKDFDFSNFTLEKLKAKLELIKTFQ